jgi:hypothetical protein
MPVTAGLLLPGPVLTRESRLHAAFEGRNPQDEQDRGAADDVDGLVEPWLRGRRSGDLYGTSVARPAIAPADAARSHHHFDRNTPHAASVNKARLTSAPILAITHAAPPGGVLVPANDAVIHKNVLPYTSSVAAAMFRRVLRRQPRVSVRSLALVP